MSEFFKNKKKFGIALGAVFMAVTVFVASFAMFRQDFGSLFDGLAKDRDKATREERVPADEEEEEPVDSWEEVDWPGDDEEPPAYDFADFNIPAEMRGTFLVPGVDFLSGSDTTEATMRADIDKAFASAKSLSINAVIIDTSYSGQVIYQTKDAPELSSGFDVLGYILEKAAKEDFYTYAIFDTSLYESKSSPASLLSIGAGSINKLSANLEEFAQKYGLDGILIDGYTAAPEKQSYATYLANGGGIGFDNYLRQTPAAIVKTASRAIRAAAPTTQVGLLADGVWENQSSNEQGSATQATYTALGDGNADTKSFVEKGYVDFVAVKAFTTTGSATEPFAEVVSWWADVGRQNDIPVYVVHATSKLFTDEAGWSSSDQLIEQLAEVVDTSGIRGSIFDNLQTVSTTSPNLADNVKKVYEGEAEPEQVLTKLEMTRPVETTFTTSDPQVTFTGAADPGEKITINGTSVQTDSTGYFTVQEDLKTGLNTFTIKHKNQTITYSITREVEILREASPMGSVTTDGGVTLTISAVAYEDADVYATIGGTTVQMDVDTSVESEEDRDGFFRTFSGQYTVPAASSETQSLGTIVVYAEYDGAKESINAASVKISKKTKVEDGVAVRVTAEQAITYPPDTLDNIPVATYYPLPQGAMDYAVGDEIVYQKKDNKGVMQVYKYYVLASGMRVESKDITAVSDDYPSNNAISGLSVKSEDGFTYITLKTAQQVSYSVKYAATGINFTFHNTTRVPSDMELSKNPLFTAASWNDQTLTLTFAKSGGYMGYKGYYDNSGNLVLRFRNPPSSLSNARIAIDPGHGGKDVGASGFLSDYPESVINSQIAQALAAELESRGATVNLMNNSGIEGEQRKQAAEKWNADLFISVHANSAPSASAAGTEVYYFHSFSYNLATNASKAVSSALNTTNRGAKQSYYHVSLSSQMPSVLVETGFLTNKNEYEKLIKSKYQKAIATGIADALAATIKSANTGIQASGSESTGSATDTTDTDQKSNASGATASESGGSSGSVAPESLWIESGIELAIGGTTTLWPEFYPEETTDDTLTWTSSDASVVTVNENGKLTAKAEGSATITVKTAKGGISESCKVTVVSSKRGNTTRVTDIDLNEISVSLNKGEAFILRPQIIPESADNKNVTFRSDKPSIATVSATGKIVAVAPGEAVITAITEDGSKKVECYVTVDGATGTSSKASDSGKPLSAAEFVYQEDDYLTLNPGTSIRLPIYNEDSDLVRGGDFTWKSEDTSIATVDSMGNVTAKKVGDTYITATAKDFDDLEWAIEVTKDKVSLSSLSLGDSSIEVSKGDTYTLQLTFYPANASSRTVVWSSSNDKIASVDSSGKVRGVNPGTATITVRSRDNSNIKESCTVTVLSASAGRTTTGSGAIQGYYIYYDDYDIEDLELPVGEKGTFTYSYWPSSVDDPGVVWESKNPSVIKIDEKGNFECLRKGSATVMIKSAANSSIRTSYTITVG